MQSNLMFYILPAMVFLTAGLGLALIPLARAMDLVDHPGHRKVHETVTALTGGPAVFVSLLMFILWQMADTAFAQALLMGGGLIFLAGLADDRQHLSPWVRFLVQVVACLVMVYWGGIYLVDFGKLFTGSILQLGPLYIAITIFAALGVINACNMIDGMDGLFGGIFLVAAGGMALYAGFAGAADLHWLLLGAIAAVLGFMLLNARLPWNSKARIFMGDSGSTLLGFFLAWCFIALGSDLNEIGHRVYMPMTAVWMIAVPLLDTATLIWRRWRAGQSALNADQTHLHHAFLRAGFSVGATWTMIMLLAIGLAVIGAVFEFAPVPDYYSFWAFVAFAFVYYFYIRRTWAIQRFLGRDFIYNDFDNEE